MPEPIEQQTVDQLKISRQTEMVFLYPQLKRDDFSSEGEYREALAKQYQAMRQQEYQYVIQNEAMKAYEVSSYANVSPRMSRCENTTNGAWRGYQSHPNQNLVQNSAFSQTAQLNRQCQGPFPSAQYPSYESCAISANSLMVQISDKMGYTGNKNLIQAVPRSPDTNHTENVTNNLPAAADVARIGSVPEEYRLTHGKVAKKYPRGVTVNQAIKDGLIGPGDEIAVGNGQASADGITSGCHAMVVVDVQKDASGKVINYTLQANNYPTLQTIDPNAPKSPTGPNFGHRQLHSALNAHGWMESKIQTEIPRDAEGNVSPNLTTEQLEQRVAEARQQVTKQIDNLHTTENFLATHPQCVITHATSDSNKSFFNNADGFADNYNRTAELSNITANDMQAVMDLERQNAAREQKLKQDEEALAQKEQDYAQKEQEFLAEYPDYKDKLHTNADGTPAEPRVRPVPVEIPPETQSLDLEERARVANARKDALDRKEDELLDREHNLDMDSSDLILRKAEIAMDPKEQEKKRKREEEQRKAEEKARKEAEKAARRAEKEARRNQRDAEPAVQPVDGQQQQQGGQQNDGEPVVHPVTSQNQEIRRIEDAAMLKGGYTELQADVRTAQDAARTQNQQIAQQQQQTELAAAEPQKTQDNKQTELTPAMQMYLQNQGRA